MEGVLNLVENKGVVPKIVVVSQSRKRKAPGKEPAMKKILRIGRGI